MSDVVIQVENLSKLYRIGRAHQRHDTLRDALVDGLRAPLGWLRRDGRLAGNSAEDQIWALKDVSFEVKRGEVLGIIGRNGAGKSTLLKILSRITEPTEGRAVVRGRVGSLLEVGTGFHPELTGRENIYLNGAILGMKKAETERKFDDIVAFAEIERFLDTPVKRYSSGMYVRLAFAVAAHLDPEILIVDEVLAVGDAAFQDKCMGKMKGVAQEGRTILFVSHNLTAIQRVCARAIVLGKGRLSLDASVSAAIECYRPRGRAAAEITDFPTTEREGNGRARIRSFRILDAGGRLTSDLLMGSRAVFEMEVECHPLKRADFEVGICNSDRQPVCLFSSVTSGTLTNSLNGRVAVTCVIPALNLTAGRYALSLAVYEPLTWECFDRLPYAITLNVVEADVFGSGRGPDPEGGSCFFPASWTVEALEGGTPGPSTVVERQPGMGCLGD